MLIFFSYSGPLGILIGCATSNGVDVLQWAACLLVGPVQVWEFAIPFGCPPVGRGLGFVVVLTRGMSVGEMVVWGPGTLAVVRPTRVCLFDSFCSGILFHVLLSTYLCFVSFLFLDLYVLGGWFVD